MDLRKWTRIFIGIRKQNRARMFWNWYYSLSLQCRYSIYPLSLLQVAQQKQLTNYLQEELALAKQQNETRLMEVKHGEMTIERLEKSNSKLGNESANDR